MAPFVSNEALQTLQQTSLTAMMTMDPLDNVARMRVYYIFLRLQLSAEEEVMTLFDAAIEEAVRQQAAF